MSKISKKRSNTIKNLIKNHYPNDVFQFNELGEIVINTKSTITILPDNSWKQIKMYIDKKISVQRNGISDDCIICFEKIQKNVTCPKCTNNICSECYINIFVNGKGVITCPHCRYSYGYKMSDCMLKTMVEEIKHKLNK